MRSALEKIYWFLAIQLGIDPRKLLRSIWATPWFIGSLFKFRREYQGVLEIMPCLQDGGDRAGTIDDEYFWQDLEVARRIFLRAPIRHLDIGSRIDGFVAHVASFRNVEVMDIRPLEVAIPGITFHQADITNNSTHVDIGIVPGSYDSISCLHALEHFGLGRYGDPIGTKLYISALKNIASLLSKNGIFYLSTPIGQERVVFNANWIFDPIKLIRVVESLGLRLTQLKTFSKASTMLIDQSIDIVNLQMLSNERYQLGLFSFEKSTDCQ